MASLAIPLPDPNDPALARASDPPPQPPDPMQDPGFRAFIAKQAQDQAALRAAQAQAASARDSTGMRVGNALLTFSGHPEMVAQRYDQAGQPVRDVLARQEAERAGTKGSQEQTALAGTMFSNRQAVEGATPGSDISKAHAMLALHQGLIKPEDVGTFTASMDSSLHSGASIQAAREKAAAEIAQNKAQQALESRKADETHRHNVAEEAFQYQKPLAPQTVTELESALSGVKALDDLKGQKDSSGVVDKLLSKVGLGDYEQTKNVTASEVAKADAKGRANPSGAIREKQLLPGAFQGNAGIDLKRKTLLDTAEQKLNVLAAGGARPAEVDQYRQQIAALRAATPTSTSGTVDVVSPEGVPGSVPADKLDAALKKGFKRAGG